MTIRTRAASSTCQLSSIYIYFLNLFRHNNTYICIQKHTRFPSAPHPSSTHLACIRHCVPSAYYLFSLSIHNKHIHMSSVAWHCQPCSHITFKFTNNYVFFLLHCFLLLLFSLSYRYLLF